MRLESSQAQIHLPMGMACSVLRPFVADAFVRI